VTKAEGSLATHYNHACWQKFLMKKLTHFVCQLNPRLTVQANFDWVVVFVYRISIK